MNFDIKKERKINPNFFEHFPKLWILLTEDPAFPRLAQFDTKFEAITYAKKLNIKEYILYKRNRRDLKKKWDSLKDDEPAQKEAKTVRLPIVNPFGEKFCCIQCGRDTKSKKGLCPKCNPNSFFRPDQIDDRKDRHVNPLTVKGA